MRKQSEATKATVNMRFLFVFNFFLCFPDDDDGTSKSSKEWSRDDVMFSEEKEDITSATMRFKKSAFFHFFLSVFFVGVVSEEDNNNTKRVGYCLDNGGKTPKRFREMWAKKYAYVIELFQG